MQKRRALFYFFVWATVALVSASPAKSQNLLDQLENRVRERLSTPETPQPTVPPNLESPPLQPVPADSRPGQSATPLTPPAADRPVLGLEAEERGPAAPYQVVVNVVRPGTSAAQAGIQPGDVILSVDGKPVGAIEDISGMLQTKRAGDSLRISVRRGDRRLEIPARLLPADRGPVLPANRGPDLGAGGREPENRRPAVVERPPAGSGRIGVTVENAATTPPGAGVPVRRGAVVVAVAPGSPADVAGMAPGNVVVAIDGRVVQDAVGLIEEMGATVPGQEIDVSFYRGGSLVRTPLRLAGADGWAAASPPGEARLGAPTGAAGAGAAGAGAAGAGAGRNGLLGGLGQAIGGMFGGAAGPSGAAGAAAAEQPQAPADGWVPAEPLGPAESLEPGETSAPADQAPADVPALEIPAPPARVTTPPPADVEGAPTETTERVPLPAGGPDEIRQLLERLQAMQRRIDVLERRLAEIEAENPAP